MNFGEFKTELRSRGFDRFADADLGRYINWGRNRIARKFPWHWERATVDFILTPGTFSYNLDTLATFGSVEKLTVTTANYRRTLTVMDEEIFERSFFPLDLTLNQYRGEPTQYFVWGDTLYVLSPPLSDRAFRLYYHARLADMAAAGDPTQLPTDLDDVVVSAALIYCHKRSNELELARAAEVDLEMAFDDMRNDEEFRMEESQDRVRPDDTWL